MVGPLPYILRWVFIALGLASVCALCGLAKRPPPTSAEGQAVQPLGPRTLIALSVRQIGL